MLAAFCAHPGTLELREVETPSLEAREVLVKVHSCGICGSDLHYYHGALPPPAACPGHEISGEVIAFGAEVSRFATGERVAIEPLIVCQSCEACTRGDYQLCPRLRILGQSRAGGFAELIAVPDYAVYRLPESVECALGALTEPLAVGVHAVRLAAVRTSERVLVLGGGTIGLLAVAAARAAGAGDVWITARYAQQVRAATDLGASRVFLDAPGSSELAEAARSQPIDVIIETVGGTADTLNDSIRFVRPGGRVVVLGVFAKPPHIDALRLMAKEVHLLGSMTYGRSGGVADFDVALHLLAAQPQRFRALLTHRFPLREIGAAFTMAGNKAAGAIKVTVAP